MSCSWCQKEDQHSDFCNHCNFCEANICCDCWDSNDVDVCYHPGDGYCPTCRERLHNCSDCVQYMESLMSAGPEVMICEKHWYEDSPDYLGKP
jgi:hypothetical protein